MRCLEGLASGKDDTQVITDNNEATLAVAVSHVSHGGGWVELPLHRQDRSPSLYVFHV
eukprot:COSAG01_NODE_8880_length_2628_cov_2.168841_2_plen_58_part_00